MGEMLVEVYGPEGAQEVFNKFVEGVDSMSSHVLQIRGDLSYVPQP